VGRHLKTSEERFWQLIAERRIGGETRERVDERIWDLYGAEWSVMFTDLAGFSRRVDAFGIIEFLELILEQRDVYGAEVNAASKLGEDVARAHEILMTAAFAAQLDDTVRREPLDDPRVPGASRLL
jgi:hypothetical protein